MDFAAAVRATLDEKPEAKAPEASPYADAVKSVIGEQNTSARSSLMGVAGQNPDQYAKARQLARQTSLPTEAVARNLPEVEGRALLDRVDGYQSKSPTLVQKLADSDFAGLSHDDLPGMAQFEDVMRSSGFSEASRMKRAVDNERARRAWAALPDSKLEEQGGLAWAARAVASGVPAFNAGAWGLMEVITKTLAPAADFAAGTILPENPLRRLAAEFEAQRRTSQKITSEWAGEQGDSTFRRGVSAGLQSVGSQSPAMIASLLTGSPTPMLFSAGVVSGGQSSTKALDKGLSPGRALLFGATDAAFEILTEKIPASKLMGDLASNAGLVKTVTNQLIRDIPGEQAATLLQDFNEWMTLNPSKSLVEFAKERPGAAAETLIATIVGTGVITTASHTVNSVAQSTLMKDYGNKLAAANAEQDFATIQTILGASTELKLRTRDAETLNQFVEAISQDTSIKEVYVDAQTLQAALGENLQAFAQSVPSVAAQLEESAVLGGDIAIPVSELVTNVAGSPYEQALLPHLRAARDGISQNEAKESEGRLREELATNAQSIAAQQIDRDAWQASSQKVFDTIESQLKEVGRFSPDVNKANASLVRDFYSVMAGRSGMTPEALYALKPLKIVGNPLTGDSLQQQQVKTDTPEFNRWFGDSKVVDADGKPLVVYHGTTSDFTEFFEAQHFGTGKQASKITEYNQSKKEGKQSVTPVFLSIKNPKRLEDDAGVDWGKEVERARGEGYDGIVYANWGEFDPDENGNPRDSYIAFDSTQIKSAISNRGAYDPNDPNILNQSVAPTRQDNSALSQADRLRDTPINQADQATALLTTVAKFDDAFQQPTPQSSNPVDIANEIDPGYIVRQADNDFDIDSGGQVETWIVETPRAQDGFATLFDNGRQVWINVASLKAGESQGNKIYGIAAAYAHNNNRVFIGDPAGLSPVAFFRRLENMISSALKYGTTDHIAPHKAQREPYEYFSKEGGNEEFANVAKNFALDWKAGDFSHNLKAMLKVSYDAAKHYVPELEHIVYDFEQQSFVDTRSADRRSRVDLANIFRRERDPDGPPMRYFGGSATAARAALYNTLVQGKGKKEWPRIVAALSRQLHRDGLDPALKDSLYQDGSESKRGEYAPSITTISLLEKANLTTFLHETGHFFLDMQAELAAAENAPQQIKDDMQAILTWMGVQDLGAWKAMSLEAQRQSHEKYAETFEQYLFTGKSPNVELSGTFARFRSWLTSVYKSLTEFMSGHNAQLTPEVRGVFDRLLATDEQIAMAEEVSQTQALYTEKPERMSDAEWTNYQKQTIKAAESAKTDMARAVLSDYKATLAIERKAIRAEVEADVMSRPVYRARAYIQQEQKLSIPVLENMYAIYVGPDWQTLGKGGKFSLLAKDGAHPDDVATLFGYSGDALVRALVEAGNPKEVINTETEAKIQERFSQFAEPEAVVEQAADSLHNSAQAVKLAMEVRALSGINVRPSVIIERARQSVAQIIAEKEVRNIRPESHIAAEARAAERARRALADGKQSEAAKQKQIQLVQHLLYRESKDLREDIASTEKKFKKVFAKDAQIAKTRNMDLVNAARAVLSGYGFGSSEKTAKDYIDPIAKYDPDTYADIQAILPTLPTNRESISNLTVDEYRTVRDIALSLWHQSRATKQITIDGEKVELTDAAKELHAQAMTVKARGSLPGVHRTATDGDKLMAKLGSAKAWMRRIESWIEGIDNSHEGPFHKFVYLPIRRAVDDYRVAKTEYIKRYTTLLEAHAPNLTYTAIDAPELGFTFTGGKPELLHAILHTGNESNKQKLLAGKVDPNTGELLWASWNEDGTLNTSKWDGFVARMQEAGVLTKADYDFAQSVWDLMEEIKPLAQKAHHDIYGYYFAEITAEPIQTPFGEYKGGYVPAKADPMGATDAATREATNALEGSNAYTFPTTGRGFTKSRAAMYNRPLQLDLRTLSSHIDSVMRFSYLQPRVREVARLVKHKGIQGRLDQIDPAIVSDMLLPWLQRTAQQMTETPMTGQFLNGVGGMARFIRRRAGMLMMFGNIVNTLQQATGISVAALKVRPKYLRNASFTYATSPRETAERITAASKFMQIRSSQTAHDMIARLDEILLDPTLYQKSQQFLEKHTYFMQSAMQNVVDFTVWGGAYDQYMSDMANKEDSADVTQRKAVDFADSTVRQTQGSFAPEDLSRMETGNAFVRLFTMFAGYFNAQANLLSTEFSKATRETGIKAKYGRMLFIYAMGLMIPAVVAELIASILRGDLEDEDDDGYLDDLIAKFFGSQAKYVTAMVPGVGMAANSVVNAVDGKPYNDRISVSPVISMLESVLIGTPKAVSAMIDEDKDMGKKNIVDALTMLGFLTGVPTPIIAKPLGYMKDVEQGKEEPANNLDFARGLVFGR